MFIVAIVSLSGQIFIVLLMVRRKNIRIKGG